MATQPRFSFDFADLRPRTPELLVLPASLEDLPPDAETVEAEARPGWIDALPAYFSARDPLRVEFARAGAFSTLLLRALSGLFATAGHDAGLEVRRWAGGFAVGPPAFGSVAAAAHVVLIPCELSPSELNAAAVVLRLAAESEPWLVLSRSLPRLDKPFGLRAEPFAGLPRERLWRLASLDASELRALAEGRTTSLGLGRFSRRCLVLAGAIVRRYRGGLA